jgi:response regulator of citrate/malate metabolism
MEGVEFVKCILPRSAAGDTGNHTYDIILSLFAAKDMITKRDVIQAANISSATATRLLTQLTKDKKLQLHRAGLGRNESVIYDQN